MAHAHRIAHANRMAHAGPSGARGDFNSSSSSENELLILGVASPITGIVTGPSSRRNTSGVMVSLVRTLQVPQLTISNWCPPQVSRIGNTDPHSGPLNPFMMQKILSQELCMYILPVSSPYLNSSKIVTLWKNVLVFSWSTIFVYSWLVLTRYNLWQEPMSFWSRNLGIVLNFEPKVVPAFTSSLNSFSPNPKFSKYLSLFMEANALDFLYYP